MITISIIELNNLTKDYGKGRGIFDVSFEINEGECFGFLGPNGAGKTTAIRHLMGFSKAQSGTAKICGLDAWMSQELLKNDIGYLPGEFAFPNGMTGKSFLKMIGEMKGIDNPDYIKSLIERFDVTVNASIRSMSLGMKRKLAVVTAFMNDPKILILDEPTSGLDPIMQSVFIDFINSEKKRGKTILLSSHIFKEVDAVCDRIAIIKDGRVQSIVKASDLKSNHYSIYRIKFKTSNGYNAVKKENFVITDSIDDELEIRLMVTGNGINTLISIAEAYGIVDFMEIPFTLEDYFMQFYENENEFEGVSK